MWRVLACSLVIVALGATATAAPANDLGSIVQFRTNQAGDHRASAVPAGDHILLLTPFPHRLLALRRGEGGLVPVWEQAFPPDEMAAGAACCGQGVLGPAVAGSRAYVNTLDGWTYAVDLASGAILWGRRVADPSRGETLTSAPVFGDGRVYVGSTGDDFGARGWIKALDAQHGRELWVRFSTGPDAEVGLAGASAGEGSDRGRTTWPADGWQRGGGEVSGQILHDPGLRLVFHGTGRPAPWNPAQRPGENRWTNGIMARDAATGEVRWFTALGRAGGLAYGAAGPLLLIDGNVPSGAGKRLVHVGLDGFVRVLDSSDGAVLSSTRFRPDVSIEQPHAAHREDVVLRDVCPAWIGATAVPAAAYDPNSKLLFISGNRLCMDVELRRANYIAGTPFSGAAFRVKPPRRGGMGMLVAWDLGAGQARWQREEPYPLAAAPTVLPNGRVGAGTLDGRFIVLDAATGAARGEAQLASAVLAQPTLLSRPGEPAIVGVVSGRGGAPGGNAAGEIDVRDATAARGFGNALRGLPPPRHAGGSLSLVGLP